MFPGSNILESESWIQDSGPRIQDPGSRIQGTWLQDPGSQIIVILKQIHEILIMDPGCWFQDPDVGSRNLEHPGSGFLDAVGRKLERLCHEVGLNLDLVRSWSWYAVGPLGFEIGTKLV